MVAQVEKNKKLERLFWDRILLCTIREDSDDWFLLKVIIIINSNYQFVLRVIVGD